MLSTIRDEPFFYSRLDITLESYDDISSDSPLEIIVPLDGACI